MGRKGPYSTIRLEGSLQITEPQHGWVGRVLTALLSWKGPYSSIGLEGSLQITEPQCHWVRRVLTDHWVGRVLTAPLGWKGPYSTTGLEGSLQCHWVGRVLTAPLGWKGPYRSLGRKGPYSSIGSEGSLQLHWVGRVLTDHSTLGWKGPPSRSRTPCRGLAAPQRLRAHCPPVAVGSAGDGAARLCAPRPTSPPPQPSESRLSPPRRSRKVPPSP